MTNNITPGIKSDTTQHLEKTYDQLCESYRAIDTMRMQLLGALPLATGTGIFFLLNKDFTDVSYASFVKGYLPAIGLFGFLVTFGLALYEAYGIRKCHALIETGKAIENYMDVPGQFLTRPLPLLKVINEVLAGGVIYPAVLAAWTFVGLYSWPTKNRWALTVFSLGFIFFFLYNIIFRKWCPPHLKAWVKKHPPGGSRGGDGNGAEDSPIQ